MTNKYELALVMGEKTTAAKKKAMVDLIDKMASTLKGKVVSTDDWGERELAYEIEKNKSGYFMIFTLELDSQGAKAIGEKIRLEDNVIRHLLVKIDEPKESKKTSKKTK